MKKKKNINEKNVEKKKKIRDYTMILKFIFN